MCHGVGLSLLIPELFFYGIFAVCFDFFRNGASGRFFSAITNLQSDNFSNFSSLGETLAIFGGSTFSGIVSQGPKFKTKKQFWNQKSKPHTKTHGRDHLIVFYSKINGPSIQYTLQCTKYRLQAPAGNPEKYPLASVCCQSQPQRLALILPPVN